MLKKVLHLCLFLLVATLSLTGCDKGPEFAYDGATLTYGKGAYTMTYAKTGEADEYYVVAGINQMLAEKDKFAEAMLDGIPLQAAQSMRKRSPAMFANGVDLMGRQATRAAVVNLALIYEPALKAEFEPQLAALENAREQGEFWCVRIKGDALNFESGVFNKYDANEPKNGNGRFRFIYVKAIEIQGADW